jgi:hypothetical protein
MPRANDADLEVLVDMLAGATYRVLQPNPPNVRQMKRYREQGPCAWAPAKLGTDAKLPI